MPAPFEEPTTFVAAFGAGVAAGDCGPAGPPPEPPLPGRAIVVVGDASGAPCGTKAWWGAREVGAASVVVVDSTTAVVPDPPTRTSLD